MPIKNQMTGYSPETQQFMQYALALEEKLKRQDKSWSDVIGGAAGGSTSGRGASNRRSAARN